MKIVNIMNFVRYIDERKDDSINLQYETTKKELELCNESGLENTFLLQYDAVCSERYQKLFKENATDKTEIGLWYEIVEPLTSACGLPYRSEYGWKWDWHITPGFSMAYTPEERERLVDEAMRKFKETFGYYPKTFASWLIDTHTINYLNDNYDISTFAICRDQANTDAYTLEGGYFNQAYYPSRNNVFTPAKSDELRINTPVFRLLGPCPIHNYESKKYISEELQEENMCFTLETVWHPGKTPEVVDWYYKTYFENEDLGFSYAHIGQENSFGLKVLEPLAMQIEKVKKLKDVEVKKMGDTGEAFKKMFPNKTPATAVTALDNWDTEDIQSVYYDCQNYTSNIMRYEDKIYIRSLFAFDERVKDKYLTDVCTTFDAVYENLPIIHNRLWNPNEKYKCGLVIDDNASAFSVKKQGEGVLKVFWGDKSVTYSEDKISIVADKLSLYLGNVTADVTVCDNRINYKYNGTEYSLITKGAVLTQSDDCITMSVPNGECELYIELAK